MSDTQFGLGWKESDWGDRYQAQRNRRAKALRSQGFDVQTKSIDFTDLARDRVAILEAHKPGTPRSACGVRTTYVKPDED